MNFYPHTIVENFYDNPDAIRKFALAQKYQYCDDVPNSKYVFPGCRTQELLSINPILHRNICHKFFSIFHNAQYDLMNWYLVTSFQVVTKEFGQGVIHRDHDCILAAVVYLSPDAPLDSGTSLFKANRHFDEEKYEQALFDNDTRFKSGEKRMDSTYHHMFDEVIRVNNVYNSMIIYEGNYFHAANQFFGESLDTGRLAQVFFVCRIEAKKANSFPMKRVNAVKI